VLFLAASVALGTVVPSARGWTPEGQARIAEAAARLVPPDFYRQLARNRESYLIGVRQPFSDGVAENHFAYPDGSGRLDERIAEVVEEAILAIRLHRPFNEIAYRAGVVSHYLADAHNPLYAAGGDPEEARYRDDFLRYMESAQPRVAVVFYGFRPGFGEGELPGLVEGALRRSRELYPMVGREYRRVGFAAGRRSFDDRSTAFAVAALATSHAVSDIAEVLRYIWLEAGGIDTRSRLPLRGERVVRLPRVAGR